MKGIKYIAGYNGENGYRTNVPSLRNKPTPFGYTDLTYAFWLSKFKMFNTFGV